MTNALQRIEHHRTGIATAIEVNWDRLIKRRPVILSHSDTPPYLLRPEIHELLRYAKQANQHLMVSTLWRTGARISEALALTPGSFHLNGPEDSYVSLQTLKQRGRPKGKPIKPRLVPITDTGYMMELESYITTHRIKKTDRLFELNRQAAHKRVKVLVERARAGGQTIDLDVTPHTFRHSFAINCLLHGIDTVVLKGWMGHKSIASTQIYLQVLNADTAHLMRWVQF